MSVSKSVRQWWGVRESRPACGRPPTDRPTDRGDRIEPLPLIDGACQIRGEALLPLFDQQPWVAVDIGQCDDVVYVRRKYEAIGRDGRGFQARTAEGPFGPSLRSIATGFESKLEVEMRSGRMKKAPPLGSEKIQPRVRILICIVGSITLIYANKFFAGQF